MEYIGKHGAKSESSDEDLSDEDIVVSLRLLITKWIKRKVYIEIENKKKTIVVLYQDKHQITTIITGLKEEILVLTLNLEDTTRTGDTLNEGYKEIVEDEKKLRLKSGDKFLEEIYIEEKSQEF